MADNGDTEKAEGPATTGKRQRSERNEWTLSDTRGPLGAAGDNEGAPPDAVPAMPEASSTATEQPRDAAEAPTPIEPPPADPPLVEPAHVEPAHVEPAHAEPSGPNEPTRRQTPVLPIVAALVVGAVIGAASAGAVYKSLGVGASQGDLDALSARVGTLEKRPDPQPEVDRLKAALDKEAAAPKPQAFDPGPLQRKIAGLESEVDGLKTQDANKGLSDKVASLAGAVAALKAQGADVKGLDDKVAGLAAGVDGLKKQDATTQAGIAALQSGQKMLEGKAGAPALAVVADSLIEAIARGRPYANQVEAAASLGADPAKVAVLRENADKGVPSAQALAATFAPLADPITATASHAPANAGLVDRLRSGMMSMVSVRRADGATGDDPGSRVSRIEADLAHDDVAGAYAAWDGLPAAAKAKSDAWGALAKTHVAAMTAARALQQQAIAALGGKKS